MSHPQKGINVKKEENGGKQGCSASFSTFFSLLEKTGLAQEKDERKEKSQIFKKTT